MSSTSGAVGPHGKPLWMPEEAEHQRGQKRLMPPTRSVAHWEMSMMSDSCRQKQWQGATQKLKRGLEKVYW